jgi:hypothetical protein
VVAAVTVAVYAGSSLPAAGFGYAFNFAEPAVATQNWNQANVALATGVALGLMAIWVLAVLLVRARFGRSPVVAGCLGLAVIAAVNLVALAQMTSHVSEASTAAQVAGTTGLVTGSRLKPGEQIAVASDVSWALWVPQAFEVPWTKLQFFNPDQAPPAGVSVVETSWSSGSARSSWPHAPAGWRIVAENQAEGWVAWRR